MNLELKKLSNLNIVSRTTFQLPNIVDFIYRFPSAANNASVRNVFYFLVVAAKVLCFEEVVWRWNMVGMVRQF